MKLIKSLVLITALVGVTGDIYAQHNPSGIRDIKTELTDEGSFALSLIDKQLTVSSIEDNLSVLLGLSGDFSFKKLKERTDAKGFLHVTYAQYYSGIRVEGATVLIHSRQNVAVSVNGKIMPNPRSKPDMTPSITVAKAIEIAQKELGIKKSISDYTPELVMYTTQTGGVLAYKARIEGFNTTYQVVMYNVYINAVSGVLINKHALIAHQDVPATASTYYSGMRPIITDGFPGGYRLIDNGRRIETYNVKGLPMNQGGAPAFVNPNDVTNNTTTWAQKLYLTSTTLTKAADSIRFTGLFNTSIFNPFGPTQSGWLVRSTIDKLQPPSPPQNVKDEIILPDFDIFSSAPIPPMELPVKHDLDIVVDAPQYAGVFRKDSADVVLDFMTLSLTGTTVDYDTNTIHYTMDTLTPGVHTWTNVNGDQGTYEVNLLDNPAIDVHWGMEQTYDFYKNTFSYYSYDDDSNSVITNYYDGVLQMMGTQNNAAALPPPYNSMVYGTGDGIKYNPVVGLDVEGHEFTHLVTGNTSNLDYQGESGALNESFSDMMGTAIVNFAKGAGAMTWHIGESVPVNVPYMRSMSDPKAPATFTDTTVAKPQPDTYLGQYWANTGMSAPDNGGVHTNSGVGNKWFYLLSQGGTGTNDNQYNYSIIPIGIAKAQEIAFTTFTNYLTSASQYIDAYNGSLLAATALYGQGSTEYTTVVDAWKAVGIPAGSTTGTGDISKITEDLRLYPNPSKDGIVYIQSTLAGSTNAELYSVNGTKLMSVNIKKGVNTIDMSSFSSGIYFLKYIQNSNSYMKKIVLDR